MQNQVNSLEAKISLLKQEVTCLKDENHDLSESHSSSRKRNEKTIKELNEQLDSLRYELLVNN